MMQLKIVKNLFRIFSLHAAQNCGYFSNILMFHKLLRKIADIFADNYTIIYDYLCILIFCVTIFLWSSNQVQASSSNWQSAGLQNRMLGVRIPPGLPALIHESGRKD